MELARRGGMHAGLSLVVYEEGSLEDLAVCVRERGVGLKGIPVGQEDDLHGLSLANAPGSAGGLPHRVDGIVRAAPATP